MSLSSWSVAVEWARLERLLDQPEFKGDVAQVAKVTPDAKPSGQKLRPRVLLSSQDRMDAPGIADHLDQRRPVNSRGSGLGDTGLSFAALDEVVAAARSRQTEHDVAPSHRPALREP